MGVKVAAVITNYNMPEATDALVEHLNREKKHAELEIIVVDNGSDIAPKSRYTTVRLEKNVQTTAGWNAGLALARGADFYWLLITSASFVGKPVLPGLLKVFDEHPEAVGVHPALTKDSTTSWEHLKTAGETRPVWMLDNIAALWSAAWFDSVGGLDPRFIYGWGPDLELSYLARTQGQSLWVSEPAGVKKITDIAYSMNRMNMSAETRKQLARQNMQEVMEQKYGPDWNGLMYVE